MLAVNATATHHGFAAEESSLQYPKQAHLTGKQLYALGSPSNAINKIVGQFVLLEVVVTIEREVPLVDIVIPKELEARTDRPKQTIQAHLISATTQASSCKKGQRLRVEGIVVDEGFGAYTIYLHEFRLIE